MHPHEINIQSCRPLRLGALLGFAFISCLLFTQYAEGKCMSIYQMDESARAEFLASIDKEEDFRARNPFTSTPTTQTPTAGGRRLSAAGRAAILKEKNLIPPLNTPSSRRISLPRATKSNMDGAAKNQPDVQTDKDKDRKKSTSEKPAPTAGERSIMEEIAKMNKAIRTDIARSETSTGKKIDELSGHLTARMSKAEEEIGSISTRVSEALTEIERLKVTTTATESKLPELVDKILREQNMESRPGTSTQGRRPRPRLAGLERASATGGSDQEAKYWLARRSLRLWPVKGADLARAVIQFLTEKLLLQPGRVSPDDIAIKQIQSQADSDAQDQVIVTFADVRQRDEVKALARNLRGSDRKVGVQLEPPDHLRGQYQSYQKLAFQMKKKFPQLRRNVKFLDAELSLTMDVLTAPGGTWKAVVYEDAKSILAKSRVRTESMSLEELEGSVDLGPGGPRKRRRQTLQDSDSDEDENDNTIVDLTDMDNNNEPAPYVQPLSFINTNARSLDSKLKSLDCCFEEKDLHFASLTETWFQDGRALEERIIDLAGEFSLGMVTRNRDYAAANGRLYGGVAFVYRQKMANFAEFPLLNPEGYEVLATTGRVTGIKGKIAVVTCYAPPNITPLRAQSMLEYISDVVGELKRKIENPTLIISGDFNQWPVDDLMGDHPDLTEVQYGPTRGSRSIDRTLTNFGRSIKESRTLPPLETEDGRVSDHRIAYASAAFEKMNKGLITYTYREYTEAGADKFVEAVNRQDWACVYSELTASGKVEKLQAVLEKLMDSAFETKTTTRREQDPPWINDKVRRLIKKRRKIYDREGRSKPWKNLKKRSDKLIKKRAARYMERQKQILTSHDATRSFYKNVRAYKSKEKPPQFDVRELYQGEADLQVAENLAEHFNAISHEFTGLAEDDIPAAYSAPLPQLSCREVEKRLTDFRKPKSMVKGDIFPSLVNRAANALSLPLCDIYNTITLTGQWPILWKIEYVTPIPKAVAPSGPNDLRNISCTQLLSKVYESFVLEWVGKQITLRTNQFGGIKGSGTEHMLVKLWQEVLENIEDPRGASLLTSIDYSKAFNRLDFAHCLKSMKAKGASKEIINIIASFLTGRTMRVKVGDTMSAPRQVLGGVPQGSLLGVLLFNLSIDDFEAYSPDVQDYNPYHDYSLTEPAPDAPDDTPVPPEPSHRDYRHLPLWQAKLLQVLKYIDDNIINEKINFDQIQTDGHSYRTKRALRTENLFRRIVHQAISQGMKVNSLKTNAMVIAELKSYIPRAYFLDTDGVRIDAKQSMKILGFHFSSDPNMNAQVASIKKKFRARTWILRHLHHRGFGEEDLVKVYRSVVLPVHDYCSCVYNSSLTLNQASALERLQAQALKSIYGYEHSYRSLLEKSGLQTLQARRDARCKKFALKCLQNPKFKDFFPLNTIARPTRGQLIYKESHARTKRLYNSPLFQMRRQLNGRTP